jgi:transposase
VIGEAAWAYQHRPWVGGALLKRQQGLDQEIKDIAWKAQWRLHALSARGKNKNQVVTAIGRELLGFIWDIAVRTEARYAARTA